MRIAFHVLFHFSVVFMLHVWCEWQQNVYGARSKKAHAITYFNISIKNVSMRRKLLEIWIKLCLPHWGVTNDLLVFQWPFAGDPHIQDVSSDETKSRKGGGGGGGRGGTAWFRRWWRRTNTAVLPSPPSSSSSRDEWNGGIFENPSGTFALCWSSRFGCPLNRDGYAWIGTLWIAARFGTGGFPAR